MDRLDKLSGVLLALICIAIAGLVVFQSAEEPASRRVRDRQIAARVQASPEFDQKSKVAAALMSAGSYDKAKDLVQGLVEQFPFEGRAFMLLGDLYMRQGLPIKAMYEYRNAIDLNPDFLDKRTEVFQGKKIKVAVEEARVAIEQGLAEKPSAENWDEYRRTLYYMQRRIKGSCG